jgi:hypothetical protein
MTVKPEQHIYIHVHAWKYAWDVAHVDFLYRISCTHVPGACVLQQLLW